VFLFTYRTFTTSRDLLNELMSRYHLTTSPAHLLTSNDNDNDDNDELKKFKVEFQRPVRLRIYNTIKHWLTTHYDLIEGNSTLLKTLQWSQIAPQLRELIRRKLKGKNKPPRMIATMCGPRIPQPILPRDLSNFQFEVHPPSSLHIITSLLLLLT